MSNQNENYNKDIQKKTKKGFFGNIIKNNKTQKNKGGHPNLGKEEQKQMSASYNEKHTFDRMYEYDKMDPNKTGDH